MEDIIFKRDGIAIIGPSGCGKTILSKKIALGFLNTGIAIFLEGKYYETDLNALLNKYIAAFGFISTVDIFEISKNLKLPVLFVIDGLNECEPAKIPKLLIELDSIKRNYQIKILITSQKADKYFGVLDLQEITVDYPSYKTKSEIAKVYDRKLKNIKLESILNTVSSGLEAKMIGEIATDDINNVSRFSLFEIFLKYKLGEAKSEAFLFLSCIAKKLSENLTFSLPEREVDDILRNSAISDGVLALSLEVKILDLTFGRISFSHELFFNFFVAESIVRFSNNVQSIIKAINLPKNYDKKLLIIGAISDFLVLDNVLDSITDVDLLNALCQGDGGEYPKRWTERKLNRIMSKIKEEIIGVEYEFNKEELAGIGFVKNTLVDWSVQEFTFINLLPYRIVQGELLYEFYDLIGIMDEKIQTVAKDLWEEGKRRGTNVRSGIFSASYVGMSNLRTAVASVVSAIRSGFVTFYNESHITEEMVQWFIKDRSLSYGKFYFVLLLLRWDEKLKYLYPYALDVVRSKWRSVPSQLTYEILDRAGHFHRTEEERELFIESLNTMNSEANNVWISTSVFEALSQIGALEEDTLEHIPIVEEQIERLLINFESEENCAEINGVFNCQFDHPYNYAYQVAISKLDIDRKRLFYKRALKGMTSVFFGPMLFFESLEVLNQDICPLIAKWTELPIIEKVFPQDSFRIFLLSHIILARYGYPLVSKFADVEKLPERALSAIAELYYWNNRKDLDPRKIKEVSFKAASELFNQVNPYTIDAIYECRHNIIQSNLNKFLDDSIIYIDNEYQDVIVDLCRFTLQNLDSQKEIKSINHGIDANTKAISLLLQLGSIVDIDVLRNLSDHSKYGKSSVEAIRLLTQKMN